MSVAAVRKMPAIGEPGWRPTEVHPLAALFPPLSDDDLAALAADIKANGLIRAITIDDAGVLIDGRMRLDACDKAGVEPRFERLNGQDVRAFIVSVNLARRNMTKGQQAMALAMIYPKPEKGGRGKLSGFSDSLGVSRGHARNLLSEARAVLKHSPPLADMVLAGHQPLDAAIETVKQEREVSANIEARMTELRQGAPDLADLVAEERLTAGEAYSAFKKREADTALAEANKREVMLRLSESAWQSTTAWASTEFVAEISERLADLDFRRSWIERLRFDPKRLDDVQRGAKALATLLARIMGGGNV